MARHRYLDEIVRLDPEHDHQRIVYLCTCFEFPFDTTRALELALFRTFCVPSTAAILDASGEFRLRAQKRYDDTDLIISELLESGYDSERGRRALRRMNQIHSRFPIPNLDYLYVLSTFILEPIRWNARWGWRPMVEQEKLGLFHFWRQVGRRMGIHDIPESLEQFERFSLEHERAHFASSPAVCRTGQATLNMFAAWFPRPLRPLVRAGMYAALDDAARQAFGFPRPRRATTSLLHATMRLRAAALRRLPDPRRPRLRATMRHRTYPQGCPIEQVGPPPAGRR